MQDFYSCDVSGSDFYIPETAVPDGANIISLTLSHWDGGTLDLDLDVSYDGGVSWMYGGGGKGAVSAEPGITFHFTYQKSPTHVRGTFKSDRDVVSTMKILAGN